jgi:polysaccharide export outer membrane protein
MINITGAVITPGSYEIDTDINSISSLNNNNHVERRTPNLSNIITAAGGLTYDADLEHIKITNKMEGNSFEVNLLDLLEKNNSENDIYLMAGDTVHVPRLPTPLAINQEKYNKYINASFTSRILPVRIIGDVNRPGLIKLDSSVSYTLNTAIAEAGGYISSSSYPPKKVFITRKSNDGQMVTTAVNPMKNDITLMPDDIVYVPEKTRPLIGKSFDFILRIISPVSSFANGYNNWNLIFDPSRFK